MTHDCFPHKRMTCGSVLEVTTFSCATSSLPCFPSSYPSNSSLPLTDTHTDTHAHTPGSVSSMLNRIVCIVNSSEFEWLTLLFTVVLSSRLPPTRGQFLSFVCSQGLSAQSWTCLNESGCFWEPQCKKTLGFSSSELEFAVNNCMILWQFVG